MREAVLRVLSLFGAGVFICAGTAAAIHVGESWHRAPLVKVADFADRDVLKAIPDGFCKMYVRMYGTDAVLTLSSGQCLVAMGATGQSLGVEVVGEPIHLNFLPEQ